MGRFRVERSEGGNNWDGGVIGGVCVVGMLVFEYIAGPGFGWGECGISWVIEVGQTAEGDIHTSKCV